MRFEDLTGRQFGKLTVLRRDDTAPKGKTKWICHCECGNEISVFAYNLKNGNTKNCVYCGAQKIGQASQKDLSGLQFGEVKVLSRAGSDSFGHSVFKCKCLRCGKEFTALGTNLRQGFIVSCGCKHKEDLSRGRQQTYNEAIEYGTNVGRIRRGKPQKNSTTGVLGVSYIKSTGMYVAAIGFKGVKYVLKTSTNLNACIKIRKEAEKEVYGNFLKWYANLKSKTKKAGKE